MKLGEMQKFFVQEAINVDPRGKPAVNQSLELIIRKYYSLSDTRKSLFDQESMKNPYYDSRILYGEEETEVKSVLVGIDVGVPELLLAKTLINSGKSIDVAISHHPTGFASATFAKIGYMQADILHKFGVPINIAEKIIDPAVKRVHSSIQPSNTQRVVDAARLLEIPFMTAHTVADNQVAAFLQREIDRIEPQYIGDILSFLSRQKEYLTAAKEGHSPEIVLGDEYSRCGKVFVDMTGGFEGPVEIYKYLAKAKVGTILTMHLDEKAVEAARKQNLNVVMAGHISSDNLGLNLMFDKLERKYGEIKFIETSGFRRNKR
ncbi:MAG: NGG1p interacting factor NIF3 [Elusimicrobiota bacterium]|jgi:putative NIF3 family GTP cyclohydrolase 1 type 2|nr:NGG1p interacting factor NIF3 [Elusimicrobiota bacterium]